MKPCPFCDTTQQYRYVFEREHTRVIYPKSPASKYHLLITPKEHIERLSQVAPAVWSEIGKITKLLDIQCTAKLKGYIGFNILSNNGDERINQRVPHCHVHIFLRTDEETNDPIQSRHSNTPPALTSEDMQYLKELQELFAS